MEKQQLADIIKSKQSLNMTEKEYRDYPAVNYSKLSTLDRNPQMVNAEFKSTDAMNLGSMVDMMITGGDYSQEYVPAMVEKPGGQIGEFADALLKGMGEAEAYTLVGFKRDKIETVIKKFNDGDGLKYYRQVLDNVDKTIVSFDMIHKATHIVNVLRTHEYTAKYFETTLSDGVEIHYQVPIVFDLPEGMGEGKALFDILVVDHISGKVIPIDLKTSSGKAIEFASSFFKWRYYLQASLYHYGLTSICTGVVETFKFIVASTTDLNNPIIWTCSQRDLIFGKEGGKSPSGFEIKGWKQLVIELGWHESTGKWDYNAEVYRQNGNLTLDVFKEW